MNTEDRNANMLEYVLEAAQEQDELLEVLGTVKTALSNAVKLAARSHDTLCTIATSKNLDPDTYKVLRDVIKQLGALVKTHSL